MANTAIATAGDIPAMAEAFKKAIEAGRAAYLAGMGRVMEKGASASSPLTGFYRIKSGGEKKMSTENHVNESILNDEIKEWQKKTVSTT